MENGPLIVTLDGPAGVGKTTLARRLAGVLGIAYLDSGAMFRCLGLKLGSSVGQISEVELKKMAASLNFSLHGSGEETVLCCNGNPVGEEVRTEEVGMLAARVATEPAVREVLRKAQQSLGEQTSLVAEGRDMGTVVFPNAVFKFFLDARPEVRASRRCSELAARGCPCELDVLVRQIRERDALDRNRTIAPLRPARDAVVLDTSNLDVDGVLAKLLEHIESSKSRGTVSEADLGEALEAVHRHKTLVHFITNYVTVNDVANITLAVGGSPIMADAAEEVVDITALCGALVLNMGTPSRRTVESMLFAGEAANKAGHPIVFDPVGAGASAFRNEIVRKLLSKVHFAIIKGNVSEIKFLAGGSGTTQGVDAAEADLVSADNQEGYIRLARTLSRKTGAVIVISGAVDIVADSTQAFAVSNGDAMMGMVSGTGCMAAGVLASFAGALPDQLLTAALAGMCTMGVAGELARHRLAKLEGGSSLYRSLLIDAVSRLTADDLSAHSRVKRLG